MRKICLVETVNLFSIGKVRLQLKPITNSTLTHLKINLFYPEFIKGKVDFSAFSLYGRGEKAEKLFAELNLLT